MDAGVDRRRGIERDLILHVRRKPRAELVHARAHIFGRLHGIRTRQLIDRHDGGRLAVVAAIEVVGLGAELDAGHILQVQHGAVGVGAQDDVAELFGGDQSTLCADGVGELLAAGHGLAADLSGGIDVVLCLQRGIDLGNGHAQLGQLIGLDPHAQRVLARTEDLHAGDALDARYLIHQIDVGVIGQEGAVIGGVRRRDRQQHQRRRKRLLHRKSGDRDLCRQLALGLRNAQLRENLVGVRIGLDVEVNGQLRHAVAGVGGLHVVHVVHAVHLLLDGRCDRLLEGLGVGPGIGGLHQDLRRHDVRELCGGQAEHRDQACDHHEDGDHHGHDGPANKEL